MNDELTTLNITAEDIANGEASVRIEPSDMYEQAFLRSANEALQGDGTGQITTPETIEERLAQIQARHATTAVDPGRAEIRAAMQAHVDTVLQQAPPLPEDWRLEEQIERIMTGDEETEEEPREWRMKGERGAARALASFLKPLKKRVSKMVEHYGNQVPNEERSLKQRITQVNSLKSQLAELKKQQKTLEKQSVMRLAAKYQEDFQRLKDEGFVTVIDVNSKRQITFTTKEITVKKNRWRKERVAGVYQIRIDPAKQDEEAVRILNITKRMDDHYDSPTISNTKPCWGNIRLDIRRDIEKANYYELITDLVAYIGSPVDVHGYIGHPDKGPNYGWEWWFENATPVEEGYSFELMDQQEEERQRREQEVLNDLANQSRNGSTNSQPAQDYYAINPISWGNTTATAYQYTGLADATTLRMPDHYRNMTALYFTQDQHRVAQELERYGFEYPQNALVLAAQLIPQASNLHGRPLQMAFAQTGENEYVVSLVYDRPRMVPIATEFNPNDPIMHDPTERVVRRAIFTLEDIDRRHRNDFLTMIAEHHGGYSTMRFGENRPAQVMTEQAEPEENRMTLSRPLPDLLEEMGG